MAKKFGLGKGLGALIPEDNIKEEKKEKGGIINIELKDIKANKKQPRKFFDNNKLNELEEYYVNLNDEIDKEIYMSPSNYLLVRNITKIYSAIYYCKTELEEFYNIVKYNINT